MPRTVDLSALKSRSANVVSQAITRYEDAASANINYHLLRWVAQMTAVQIHTFWERYVEHRLVAALNHDASHFLKEYEIKGVSRVSSGLAYYIVRGGGRFFDFRSSSDLIEKGDRWLGNPKNPFRALSVNDRAYLDALAAIRNCVVHRSDAARAAYRRTLKSLYGITSAPEPFEFLHAKDNRPTSPARYKSRLHGLAKVISRAIQDT